MSEWRELPTMADVAAAQAAGDEIEYLYCGRWVAWYGTTWDLYRDFRARPRQPKTKKLKIYGYLDMVTGRTFTVVRGMTISGNAIPYPKLDDEIEVEE